MIDAESAAWIGGLRERRDETVPRLHELLLRFAMREANRRAPRLRISGPEVDDLAHQAADDAVVAVLAKLDGFRGESRFTTWAYRFVVLELSTKVGRHFWARDGVRFEPAAWEQLPGRFGLDPADRVEWGELMAALRCAVDEQLTPHQRRLFVAVVLNGVPLDALVIELDSSRGAIYKALFDARRKLRAALVADGYLVAS